MAAHRLAIEMPHSSHRLTRVDARLKVVCGAVLLGLVTSSSEMMFPLLVALLSLTLCLALGVSPKTLLFRFSEPLLIATVVLLLKLFSAAGAPLFTLNLLGHQLVAHRDGLLEGGRIASRIAGAVTVMAAVGFATPFTELMAALSWFKVPQVLVDISLFAWRYLFLLFEDAQVVYHAQKNRLGYVGYARGLRSMGTLAGVLVIKAFDNSQQITTAMVQRGYDGDLPLLRHRPFVPLEVFFCLLFLVAMAAVRSL
ncbi:cobalt ECF transporter T component CbiQ [Geomesophilobacter sediminis]|uniref:Cobalt ECF transporter T component CbiQ n=1 Tax=Geomesophilobacter sediminis TaxID=2798584 RepID=A0A8J7JCW0_9BACT|nr:cobalt ECF transporter T component CbiQ [Geomesophilobacter sediminis]MBJ6724778.1 cobalt ECF transporter T component CbiQ [Geomesophilobacter sediminis]